MNRSIPRLLACSRLACIALALPAFGGCALTAHRPIPQPEPLASVRVAYSDLDFSRAADVSTLLDRIEQAAYRACGRNPRRHPAYELMPEHTKAVFQACRDDAIARAVGTIGAPALFRAFAQLQRSEAKPEC